MKNHRVYCRGHIPSTITEHSNKYYLTFMFPQSLESFPLAALASAARTAEGKSIWKNGVNVDTKGPSDEDAEPSRPPSIEWTLPSPLLPSKSSPLRSAPR